MNITIIIVVSILIIILLILAKSRRHEAVERLTTIDKPNKTRYIAEIDPNFIEGQFHADYMDVITSFNNLSANRRQIFNINNVPCEVTKDVDQHEVYDMLVDFTETLNEDIKKNVPMMHTANSGWDELLPEHTVETGWEKVQKQLGLPTSLFTKPKMHTHVRLSKFSYLV